MSKVLRWLVIALVALDFLTPSSGFIHANSAAAQPYNFTTYPYLPPNGLEVNGYHVDAGTTGGSYTFLKNQSYLILNNTGSVTFTITLYSYPLDGQWACMFSKGGVGTLTLNAGLASQSVTNGITAMTANTQYCFAYVNAANSWYRVQ